MRNIKILSVITLLLIFGSTLVYAAPPLPVRVGGTLKVDGTFITQATDTGYTVKITKQDESAYDPVAEDTDGLNSSDYYVIDVPILSGEQPGGAEAGDTAVIHVYLDDNELTVTSPTYGQFQIGSSGSTQQINVEVSTLVSDISVTDSLGSPDDFEMAFPDLTIGLSINMIVKITNNGDSDLNIYDVALSDQLSDPFSINTSNCSNSILAPNDDCKLVITFNPVDAGTFSDSFDIPSSDPDSSEATITINVSGTGLAVTDNNLPPLPELSYPADGQTITGTSLQFKWKKVIDPDLNSVSYYLYCSTDPDFIDTDVYHIASIGNKELFYASTGTGFLLFGFVLSGGIRSRKKIALMLLMTLMVVALSISCGSGGGGGGSSGGGGGGGGGGSGIIASSDITQTVSGLSAGETYYWKVVADDGNGGLTESETQSFTTQQEN